MNFGIKQLGWGRQSSGHAGLTVELSQDHREAETLTIHRYGPGKGAPPMPLPATVWSDSPLARPQAPTCILP